MSNSNFTRTRMRLKATRHIVMGIILLALGAIVAWKKMFLTAELPVITSYLLGGLLIFYGLFRVWRGIQDLKDGDGEDYVV